jgi:ribonuclease Z
MIHSAALINDPFGDPGVYMDFKYCREAFLFELGDIHALSSGRPLRLSGSSG